MIKHIDINLLKEATYNPRKPLSNKEYMKLKKSFKEFGEAQPIVINKDYTVIAGHQRLKVMKDLGYTQVECKILDLTKEKEKALNIALNKIQGEWDYDKLTTVIGELFEQDFSDLTGFDDKEIMDLVKVTENLHATDNLEEIIKETAAQVIQVEKSEQPKEKIIPKAIPLDTFRPANNIVDDEQENEEKEVIPAINEKLKSFVQNKVEQKIDMTFSLNTSQNETVIKALDQIKKRDNIIFGAEAITKICEEWLANE